MPAEIKVKINENDIADSLDSGLDVCRLGAGRQEPRSQYPDARSRDDVAQEKEGKQAPKETRIIGIRRERNGKNNGAG